MADIHTIHGAQVRIPDNQPVPELVRVLEGLLERAQLGELRSITFATITRDNFGCGWTSEGTEDLKDKMLAATAILQHRLLSAIEERGMV